MTGCEERFPVYSSFCEKGEIPALSCLRYPSTDPRELQLLKDGIGIREAHNCPYYLKLTKYRVGACSNPVVKSTGSDFDGYVRIEIFKGFTCYYKVQSDYKHDPEAAFDRVLQKIKEDFEPKK